MLDPHLGAIFAGLALLALTAICWSGMWKGWLDAPQTPRSFFIATLPGLGICLLGFGFSTKLPPDPENAVGAVSGLVAIAGVILSFWEPDWYGPRWFREFKRAFHGGGPECLAWMAGDPRRPGESSVEATQRHLSAERPIPPSRGARLISAPDDRLARLHGTRGLLFFWPQAPVFSVGGRKVDIPVDEIIPTESMRAARKLPPGTELDGTVDRSGLRSWLVPRVYIDTADGAWLFQCRRAKRVTRAIQRRYLDPSRDIYGLPLDKKRTPPEFEKGATSPEPDLEASQQRAPRSSGRPKAWRPRG